MRLLAACPSRRDMSKIKVGQDHTISRDDVQPVRQDGEADSVFQTHAGDVSTPTAHGRSAETANSLQEASLIHSLSTWRRVATTCVLLLSAAALGGCPRLPIGDPNAEARVTNDTAGVIAVELTLDANTFGKEGPDAAGAQQQLQEFQQGEGVTMTSEDVDGLIGKYDVAPGGVLVVYQGMGTEPFYLFTRMTVTRGGESVTVEGEPEIRKRFVNSEGNLYELKASGM